MRIARLGVLPGLMDNGRWSDQHNARAVYHWITVRSLAALLRALPADDEAASAVRAKTLRAVRSGVEDVLRNGGGNGVVAYVGLAEALDFFGPEATWERALEELGVSNPYTAGVFARRRAATRRAAAR